MHAALVDEVVKQDLHFHYISQASEGRTLACLSFCPSILLSYLIETETRLVVDCSTATSSVVSESGTSRVSSALICSERVT